MTWRGRATMLWVMKKPTDQELEWAAQRLRLWLRELVKRAMAALREGRRL